MGYGAQRGSPHRPQGVANPTSRHEAPALRSGTTLPVAARAATRRAPMRPPRPASSRTNRWPYVRSVNTPSWWAQAGGDLQRHQPLVEEDARGAGRRSALTGRAPSTRGRRPPPAEGAGLVAVARRHSQAVVPGVVHRVLTCEHRSTVALALCPPASSTVTPALFTAGVVDGNADSLSTASSTATTAAVALGTIGGRDAAGR